LRKEPLGSSVPVYNIWRTALIGSEPDLGFAGNIDEVEVAHVGSCIAGANSVADGSKYRRAVVCL
jgi:hypothetical protein